MKKTCYLHFDYIIRWYNSHKLPYELDNRRLQKIAFVAYVLFAREYDGARLFDETFEAWDYGPVIPKVYEAYSIYAFGKMFPLYLKDNMSSLDIEVLKEAIELTKDISTEKLIKNAHPSDAPWVKNYKTNRYHTINTDTIHEYYSDDEHFKKLIEK